MNGITTTSRRRPASSNATRQKPTLKRKAFATSRVMDFFSEKELTPQIGHGPNDWSRVAVKELIDNALDACEEAGVAPEIEVTVDESGLTVIDNGPGLPSEVISRVLDFTVRVSTREAYVSPCRGAQGNALKTLLAMVFVIDGEIGHTTIIACGTRHEITMRIDRIHQRPVIEHETFDDVSVKTGTFFKLHSPSPQAGGMSKFLPKLDDDETDDDDDLVKTRDFENDELPSPQDFAKSKFLPIISDFTFLNPHVSVTTNWFGESSNEAAADQEWSKWKPSEPTSPHWYELEHLERLIAANIAMDGSRLIRDFIGEFRGLSSTSKRKTVLEAIDLQRAPLSDLVHQDGRSLNSEVNQKLLDSMKAESKKINPAQLGVIGRVAIAEKFSALGCEMETFAYHKASGEADGLPWVLETAFAWCEGSASRRIITGVNFSPCVVNPFREIGKYGKSLDTILSKQRATADEPVVLLIHLTCPRVTYLDRGKSAIVIE